VRGPEGVGGEAEAVGRTGGEVLHEHVGPGHQAGERLPSEGVLEVERDRLLVPVRPREVRAQTVDDLVVAAGKVAAGPALDLDDAGTEVAQVPSADRRRDRLFNRDHGDAL
jgi:hypothetical protein